MCTLSYNKSNFINNLFFIEVLSLSNTFIKSYKYLAFYSKVYFFSLELLSISHH